MRHIISGMLGFAVGLSAGLLVFGTWRHAVAGLIAVALLCAADRLTNHERLLPREP